MSRLTKFSKIGQFNDVIYEINKQYKGNKPILNFRGTVKLHGSNASVCYNEEDGFFIQSRSNIITIEKDNHGCAMFCEQRKIIFTEMLKYIANRNNIDLNKNTVSLFFEWCGGNIQGGVALSQLEKMAVLMSIKISPFDEEKVNYYLPMQKDIYDVDEGIYNILSFEHYLEAIDFNRPDLAQPILSAYTESVDKLCPVGDKFGVSGVGEGVVWEAFDSGIRYAFKVKGEKHSASKVKTLAPIDVEKVESEFKFLEYACTENRLKQGIEEVFIVQNERPSMKGTGDFIQWVIKDIMIEEKLVIVENNIDVKSFNKRVAHKARGWLTEYIGGI